MNLKSKFKKIFLIFASLVFIITALPLTSFAEVRAKQVNVDAERFMTDEIVSEGGFLETDESGYVIITPSSKAPSVSFNISVPKDNIKTNSLRIVLKNSTSCGAIDLNYTYTNEENLRENANVKVKLENAKEPKEYIIPLEGTDSMSSLKLTFPCDGDGSITLLSVCNISYYFDEREYFGTLTENVYDRKSGEAHLSGKVSYDINVKYPDAKVVLYRLDQDKIIEDLTSTQSYIESCDMTLEFGFTFKVEKTSDLCSRYFIAVLTPDGKVIPVTSETYLKETYTSTESLLDGKEPGFKGIETNLNSGASEIGTSVAFIDINLDEMGSESKNGYQYTLDDGKEYYFDREYIADIDRRMKSFAVSGTSVYFRFLLNPNFEALKYSNLTEIPDDVKYISINPHDDKSVRNLYASTDFLFRRYLQDENVTLRGVVLGRSIDKIFTHNYCVTESMNSYVDMIARTCSIVRRVLDAMGSELEIVLPLSDEPFGIENVISKEHKTLSYPTDLLTRCVVKALSHYGTDISSIYFMLENSHTPLSNDELSKQYVTALNCKKYIEVLKDIGNIFPDVNNDIMFCWFPEETLTDSKLKNAFIYSYNLLACTDGIRTFVTSIFENQTKIGDNVAPEKTEQLQLRLLRGTFKYADTYMNSSMGKDVLAYLNVNSWSEIIKNYDFSKIERKNYYNKNLGYIIPSSVTGSYVMFDFMEANGTKGWSAFEGCKSLLVYTEPEFTSHSMVASFSGSESKIYGGEYGSIIHKFRKPISTRDVSYISFDLFISFPEINEMENNYELVITAGNDESIFETVGTIKSGARTTVIADITELESVDYIKVSAKNLDSNKIDEEYNLCIEKINFHSTNLSDRELAEKMSEETSDEKEENSIFKGNTEFFVVCSVVAVSFVVLIAVWLVLKRKTKLSKSGQNDK